MQMLRTMPKSTGLIMWEEDASELLNDGIRILHELLEQWEH